jgi:hypothetical protein
MVPQQGLQPWIARLGDDLAVAVRVEAVHHDPVVPDQIPEAAHHRVGEHADRGGRAEHLDRGIHMREQLIAVQRDAPRGHLGLDFHQQHVAGNPVHRALEDAGRAADRQGAAQRHRRSQFRLAGQCTQHRVDVAAQQRHRPAEQRLGVVCQQGRRIGAGLQDLQRAGLHR